MNSFAMLQALIFEPRKAFADLSERPRFLFPLALIVLSTAAIVFWYYQIVDLAWLTDRQLRASAFASQMTEAQIEARVKSAGANRGVSGVFAALITALGTVIGYLLVSTYYLLAGKVTNVQRSFRHWFALSCWSSLPSLLGVIPAAFVLASTTTTQLDDGELRVLSLNSLFFHRAFGDPGYALLSAVGLPELLSVCLTILGVRVWSGRSWLFSAVFTLLPLALIGGAVALFTMGRS